jgi:hypothetical protein
MPAEAALSNTTVLAAMLGWPFVALLLFACMPPRKAAIVSFLAAWMFLPDVAFPLPGIPDYTKTSAATVGAFCGVLLFDAKTLLSIRPWWGDLPVLVYCLTPFASSVTNGLGAYDGMSAVVSEVLTWGLPYLLGRAYLRSLEAFRELATLLFVAGLIYMPLCLYEIRMSPQLNRHVYGFGFAGGGEYARELGVWGSRPRVFMGTGLALGTFMTAASLAGAWLCYTGAVRRVWGFRAGSLAVALMATAFLCKNMGALALLVFGLTALFSIRILNRSFVVYLLIMAAPSYMAFRATGSWSADSLVQAASTVHAERGKSLQGRLTNDTMLAAKALERPAFGWGGWGRSRIYNKEGKDIAVTDGLWIIVLGTMGLAGLVSLTLLLLLPAVLFARRYPVRYWIDPRLAPAAVAAVLVVLYMIDNLFNSMFNPVYVMSAGGLVTIASPMPRPSVRPARRPSLMAPIAS